MYLESPYYSFRLWVLAALITGWMHGIADFFMIRNSLPPVLYDWSDKAFLWVITTGILTGVTLIGGIFAFGVSRLNNLVFKKNLFVRILWSGLLWSLPLTIANLGLSGAMGIPLFVALAIIFVLTGFIAVLLVSLSGFFAKLAFFGLIILSGVLFWVNATQFKGIYALQHESLAYISISFTFAAMFLLTKGILAGIRVFKHLSMGILGLTVVMLIEGFVLGQSMKEGIRAAIFGETVETVHALRVIGPMLDPDMDGATAFAGIDCANFDPSTHPGARDIIDDNKDQDCLGGPARSKAIERLLHEMAMPQKGHWVLPENTPVIFLSVDALRLDFAEKMRTYKTLKQVSVTFENAHCAYPGTILSFYSLLTGKAPLSIRTTKWIKWQVPLNDTAQTLAEVLKKRGYSTTGVFFHGMLAPSHGITKGFGHAWTAGLSPGVVVWGEAAEITAKKTISAIKSLSKTGRPFFLWAHFYDPHEPYIQHKAFPVADTHDWRQLYAGEVKYTDLYMMQVIQYLQSTGLFKRALIVFFADHGESLGEHGQWFHDSDMYEEQTKVPLLIAVPGLAKRMVIKSPVSLRWLGDTVCDLLGIQRPENTQGGSLYPLIMGQKNTGKGVPPIFMEVSHGRNLQRAVILWPWKLIYHVNNAYFELYNLKRDPHERINLYDVMHKTASGLARILGTWVAAVNDETTH